MSLTLPVLSFSTNKTCKSCALNENASSVCVPTSLLTSPPTADTVILAVNAAPGPTENQSGAACSPHGHAGKYFYGVYRKFVDLKLLGSGAEPAWAVTNAVRCMPPKDATITAGQVAHCKEYLVDDVRQLAKHYKRIVILAMGEPAARSVVGTGLTAAMKQQGKTTLVGDVHVVVFSTANPFVLSFDPAVIHYVRDHLNMLVDFLKHGKIPMTLEIPKASTWSEEQFDAIPGTPVSVDTETYGAVAGLPEQTAFHPVKALLVDGVRKSDMVLTAAAAWLSPDGMRTRVWVLPRDNPQFIRFLKNLQRSGNPLLGMNLPYDMKMIRAMSPYLQWLMSRERGWKLMDLSVANFLNSDIRPERSLKDIAPLLRIVQYDEKASLKNGFRYPSRTDPNLLKYCVMDAAATLEAWIRLRDLTLAQFPGTARFSDACVKWYSDVLWTVIRLDEAGVAFSRKKLEWLHRALLSRMKATAEMVTAKFPGIIVKKTLKRKSGNVVKEILQPATVGGPGSAKWITSVFNTAVDVANLRKDPRLETTKSSGYTDPCTHKDNMNLLLGVLPIGHAARAPLEAIRRYRRAEKLSGTYTGPLLNDPGRGLVGDMAYPSWYPVPSSIKDGGGESGGTQQGRLTCKSPALQTMPKHIKWCMMARHPGWVLKGYDLSQIELRIAALLSGDELMVGEYIKGVDRHADQARLIFGADTYDGASKEKKKKLRHIGKTLNFLVLFKGGPDTFQETVRRMLGVELDIQTCRNAIRAFDQKYRQFRRWQDKLIADVTRQGYMELPLPAGEARTFCRGKQAMERYVAEIVNFPIQTLAANVLKDAQCQIQDEFDKRKMKATVCLNIYDALYVDFPAAEEAAVDEIVSRILPNPPFYQALQSYVGREVPLAFESETLDRRATK